MITDKITVNQFVWLFEFMSYMLALAWMFISIITIYTVPMLIPQLTYPTMLVGVMVSVIGVIPTILMHKYTMHHSFIELKYKVICRAIVLLFLGWYSVVALYNTEGITLMVSAMLACSVILTSTVSLVSELSRNKMLKDE
jgi:hypothetical protein